MNSGVTSINELPSSNNSISSVPIQPQNNIIMNTMEHISQPTSQLPNMQLNQPQMERRSQNNIQDTPTNYNELVSQLQQAIQRGATNLPSRDIPINTNKITSDENIKPNFIPNANNQNYINNDMSVQDLINQDNKNSCKNKTYEQLFFELKLPILIGLLFFIFQIPTFKKIIRTSIPFLNNKDGNNNFYGYIFNTLLFVIIFYLLNKLMDNMTNYIM